MRFCSPDKLTSLIGLSKDADNYAALETLQDGMQATFEAYLHREFDLLNRVSKVFFNGSMIPLASLPIRKVGSVTLTAHAGVIQGLGYVIDLKLNPNDYMITPYGIKLVTYKANGSAYVTVTYDGGIDAVANIAKATDTQDTAVIRALEQASIQQLAYEWSRKDNFGATRTSSDGGTTMFPELDLLKTVKRLLDPHKHPLGGFF